MSSSGSVAVEIDVDDRLDPPRPRGQYGDPLAEVDGLVDAVGDEQDGLAGGPPDAQQLVLQRLAGLRVQCRERLVHQQHFGVEGEAAGDRHPLLHTAGQFVRITVGESGQADQFEVLAGDHAAPAPANSLGLQAELDIAPRGAPGQQRVLLEDDAAIECRGR